MSELPLPEDVMPVFWFWVHNCVAHPLLCTGARWATRFHDWTAEKMTPGDSDGVEIID